MPLITLRTQSGLSSKNDLTVEVKENTLEYLRTTQADTIRVSAYLDRDWPEVSNEYAELFIDEDCASKFQIVGVTPGSRVRKGIQLPGAMKQGEQLTLEVKHTPAPAE